jgi:hypothetical protein
MSAVEHRRQLAGVLLTPALGLQCCTLKPRGSSKNNCRLAMARRKPVRSWSADCHSPSFFRCSRPPHCLRRDNHYLTGTWRQSRD